MPTITKIKFTIVLHKNENVCEFYRKYKQKCYSSDEMWIGKVSNFIDKYFRTYVISLLCEIGSNEM